MDPNVNVIQSLVAAARKKCSEIKDADLSWLCKPDAWKSVPYPCIFGGASNRFKIESESDCFSFMGRLALDKLVTGIDEAKKNKKSIVNVLGTKFFGKSHIIAAYVAMRMQACHTRNERPIIFLPYCSSLGKYGGGYLKYAMTLAFAANDNALSAIAQLENTDDMFSWLQGKQFDVAADQRNAIAEKLTEITEEEKKVARDILNRLTMIVTANKCTIMSGFSANNEIMTKFYDKERANEHDILFYGGFDEVRYY